MPLQKEKALLIINPKSGKQIARKNIFNIISLLSQRYTLSTHITENEDDAKATAAQAEEYDTVIVCGGDGTLGQVIDGYPTYRKTPMIGYIPCGTANDFAATMGIPKDIRKAANMICSGTPLDHDVGCFNGRKFIYIASFGAFTKASYATSQDAKNMFGSLAYIVNGVFDVGSIKGGYVKVKCGDRVIESDDACFFSAGNSTTMGGGVIKIPPETIDLNDGKLDMLMINLPKTLPRLMEVVGKLQKSVFDDPDIFFLSGERFEIETGTPVEWTLDGEDAGFHKNVVIEAEKSAIKLVRKDPCEIEQID
ncbi:MAG: YegS/Rv2252/BmrU family lipid kinase [Clostridia bacterium]|nr:YegS/Rv2252/BmrU family lipid kinase [Clostridia bacterium]